MNHLNEKNKQDFLLNTNKTVGNQKIMTGARKFNLYKKITFYINKKKGF